jgi:HAD superfamily hydrolase (TIGR01548 family)
MSELFIKQELFKLLPSLDAILFDVDGVLLDVSQSFRAAICDTTQHYAVHHLELKNNHPLLTPEETEFFKFAGGFNDDCDLTNAVVMLITAKMTQTDARDTLSVHEMAPTWRDYTTSIKRAGGGLVRAEGVILEMLTPHQRRDFARAINFKLVTQLFQEFYAGDDACHDLYGFNPEYVHGEGYYKRETLLIDPEILPKGLKYGVVTGRSIPETRLALRHAKLLQKIPENGWITPEIGFKKPDGHTLVLARDRLDFKNGLYIGDIMDDLQTVLNYRELKGAGKGRIAGAIALSGPSGDTHKQQFLEAGADVVTPDVNTLLSYLKAVVK